jgi:RecA/RadA recombinase
VSTAALSGLGREMSTGLGESAAQAILRRENPSRLSTCSQRLDDAFVSGYPVGVDQDTKRRLGGIPRATVGEIVGPPGIGKTTLA